MQSLYTACAPRPEVLQGDLGDAIFAADFGHVVEGRAPSVYQDAQEFFQNTHPAAPLKNVIKTVFSRLADPNEAGATVRLSTGFGGGKTHTMIALWHLASHVKDTAVGTELLEAAGRPPRVAVAGIDGEKLGANVCGQHGDTVTHSLWGELAYQLGGAEGYAKIADQDDPETAPDSASVRALLPEGTPVLILMDEIVKYMVKLSDRGSNSVLAFLGSLISEVGARRQAVLVITDPAAQVAYQQQSTQLSEKLKESAAASKVEDELGRKTSNYDPIGNESAQVIVRRLFDKVDKKAADAVSAEYYTTYKRVSEADTEMLPHEAATMDYAKRIVECYPFHPRLLETAQNRLGAMENFQKSRGTLRLFARILRDAWDSRIDVPLLTAGEIDWGSERIQADLLQRLDKDAFKPAVDADVIRHAGSLDANFGTDIHRRVASALLLESLPMTANTAMDKRDLTLATLRPADVGNEAGEAIDRLLSVCWHTYKDDTGRKYQFRYEANINKLIEERAKTVPLEDARAAVRSLAQSYFGGTTFKLIPYPAIPRSVSDSTDLKLVLTDNQALAQAVCDFADDSDPSAKVRRDFRNAVFGIAPDAAALDEAVQQMRSKIAADEIEKEEKSKTIKEQIKQQRIITARRATIRTMRAFTRIVFQGKKAVTLDEKYLVPEESPLEGPATRGQDKVKDFLDDNKFIYQPGESPDVDLMLDFVVKGSTPSTDYDGAYPASAVHERALRSEKLRLLRDADPIRRSLLNAVTQGKLVVRLPSGEVYDGAGCVSGPVGARLRSAKSLTTLALNSDVFVAPTAASCVSAWTKTDDTKIKDPPAGAGTSGETTKPSYKPDTMIASSWDQAINSAAKRPLNTLILKASTTNAAKTLANIAQPFGSQSLTLSVSLLGSLKDGGNGYFMVSNVKANGVLKPLDTAAMLMRAMTDEAQLEVQLDLAFGDGGLTDAAPKIMQAEATASDGVTLEAFFGKESSNQDADGQGAG